MGDLFSIMFEIFKMLYYKNHLVVRLKVVICYLSECEKTTSKAGAKHQTCLPRDVTYFYALFVPTAFDLKSI